MFSTRPFVDLYWYMVGKTMQNLSVHPTDIIICICHCGYANLILLNKEYKMTNFTLKNALQTFDYNHMTPYAVGFDRT